MFCNAAPVKLQAPEHALLMRVLDERERRILASYLFDGDRQNVIAALEGTTQQHVSRIVEGAIRKLAAAGVDVERPDARRLRLGIERPRLTFVDHATLDRHAAPDPFEAAAAD